MNVEFASVLHLLHEAGFGSLATQASRMPGYPFASVLPFAADERHCPVFFLSRLAEHTKNLLADKRASFLVHGMPDQNILASERVTLIGDVEQIEASSDLIARYLRYQPDARQYLGLGDFAFFRLMPRRARYIAGFGNMGWVEEAEWSEAAALPLADEERLVGALAALPMPDTRPLGIDCYGLDIERKGRRERWRFPDAPLTPEQLGDMVNRARQLQVYPFEESAR